MKSDSPHLSQSVATPSWRRGFTSTRDADRFWDLVVGMIPPSLGDVRSADRDDGSIHLESGGVIFVTNPALDIVDVPANQWPAYISWWLDNLAQQPIVEIQAKTQSWAEVKAALRVRLFPAGFTSGMIGRSLTSTLIWGVAIELAAGATPVPIDRPAVWGVKIECVWDQARRNTAASTVVGRTDVIAMQRHFRLLEGDIFTTGALDDLRSLVPEIRGEGALVVAPTSYSLLVQPIDGWDGVPADASRLLVASMQFQDRASHQLPLTLLWYRGPGDLVPAAEFAPTADRPHALDVLAPDPLRSVLRGDRGENRDHRGDGPPAA